MEVDVCKVDYLTLTTFDPTLGNRWATITTLDDELMRGAEWKNARRMQYTGRFVNLDEGSIYAARGEQRGRKHWMLQVSGGLSHSLLFGWLLGNNISNALIPRDGEAFSCSRIDLQATVDNEDVIPASSASFQDNLFKDVGVMGKTRAWFEDAGKHGKSITVGINKRRGERYIRVYPKQGRERDFLRFEIEYKGDNANRAFNAVFDNGEEHIKKILSYEIKKLGVSRLIKLFIPLTGDESCKLPKRHRPAESGTVTWLLSVCLPALQRCLLKEENGRMLYTAFMGVLSDYEERNEGDMI